MPDVLELSSRDEAYEVRLLPQRRSSLATSGEAVVLFRIPHVFFQALQSDPIDSQSRAKQALLDSGFTYWAAGPEVSQAWEFQTEYGSFRWWSV